MYFVKIDIVFKELRLTEKFNFVLQSVSYNSIFIDFCMLNLTDERIGSSLNNVKTRSSKLPANMKSFYFLKSFRASLRIFF